MADRHSILYRRRDTRGKEHRNCLLVNVAVSYLDAERIAKNLLDDFAEIVETAWVEAD